MTIPGGIQQLSVPGFVQGGGGHVVDPRVGGFERGMQTLLQAIAARKRQELEEAKFHAQQAEQAQVVEATETLGKMLEDMANKGLGMPVPGMAAPNIGPMGGAMPPAMFGAKQADPMQAAIAQQAKRPGGYFALGQNYGSLAQGMQNEIFNRRQGPKQADLVWSEREVSIDGKTWIERTGEDPKDGAVKSRKLFVPPPKERTPGTQAPGTSNGMYLVVDPKHPQYGKYVNVSVAPGEGIDAATFFPAGKISEQQRQAGLLYEPMLTAYQQTRGSNIDPKDVAQFQEGSKLMSALASVSDEKLGTSSDWTRVNHIISKYGLQPQTRKWLQGMYAMANYRLYAVSGKAVTPSEYGRILISEIPGMWDTPEMQTDKWKRLEATVSATETYTRPALASEGKKLPLFDDVRRTESQKMEAQSRRWQRLTDIQNGVVAEMWPGRNVNELPLSGTEINRVNKEVERRYRLEATPRSRQGGPSPYSGGRP